MPERCPKCVGPFIKPTIQDLIQDVKNAFVLCPEPHPCGEASINHLALHIAELERQLEEAKATIKSQEEGLHAVMIQREQHGEARLRAESELRDSQLAVVALRKALVAYHANNDCAGQDPENCEQCALYERADKALSNTSATAQQVRAEIEREALEKAVQAVGEVEAKWEDLEHGEFEASQAAIRKLFEREQK